MTTELSELVDGRYESNKLDRAKWNIRRFLPADLTPSKKLSNDTAFNVLLVDAMHAEYLAYVEETFGAGSDDLEEAELLVKMSLEYLSGISIDLMRTDTRYRVYLEESLTRDPHAFLRSIPTLFPKILRQIATEEAIEEGLLRKKQRIEAGMCYYDTEDYLKSLYEQGRLSRMTTEALLLSLGLTGGTDGAKVEQAREVKRLAADDMARRIAALPCKKTHNTDEKELIDMGIGFLKQSLGYSPEMKKGGFTFDMLVGQVASGHAELDEAIKHVAVCLGYALNELYPS